MNYRFGITLVETMILLGIIVIMICLLLPTMQSMRESSLQFQSKNHLRQIILSVHDYASVNRNALPLYHTGLSATPGPTVFLSILPYCGDNAELFLSPADPSRSTLSIQHGLSSYAANAQVFINDPNLLTTFKDSISNTIAFAEHYSTCSESYLPGFGQVRTEFSIYGYLPTEMRKATFADEYDVRPLTDETTHISRGSDGLDPARTFQVAPLLADCAPEYAQAPHRSGMLVAMADSAVKTLSPSIADHIYWALVTPAGGETIGLGD